MAITSIGYAGTVDDVEWARLIPWAGGSDYSVPDPDHYQANSAPGDRNVDISPGYAAGFGVLDQSDSTVTVNLPSVGSGSRWDLVGLRRIWATQTTTVFRVAGSSSKALPTLTHTPGVEDVQPLWLLRVAAGQTAIQEFVDLRAFVGNGGAWAADDLVRSYLDRVGTVLTVGSIRWERHVEVGIPTWVRVPVAADLMATWTRNQNDNYFAGSYVDIGTVSLPSARPGRYLVTWQLFISGNVANAGDYRVMQGALQLFTGHADIAGVTRIEMTGSRVLSHTGGNLAVTFFDRRSNGLGTVYAPSTAQLVYLGPL